MRKLVLGAAFALAISLSPAFTYAAGLSSSQIQSILALLSSFGADASVVANVNAALSGTSTGGSSSPFCYTFKNDLTVGSGGGDVTALNQALTASGIDTSGNGASFTENSAADVVSFQAKNGIRQTGYVGPLTRGKLNSLYGCGNKVNPPKVSVTPLIISSVSAPVYPGAPIDVSGTGFDSNSYVSIGNVPGGVNSRIISATYRGADSAGYGHLNFVMPSDISLGEHALYIAEHGSSQLSDKATIVVTASAQNTYTVTYPNGGEVLNVGTAVTITWNGPSPDLRAHTGVDLLDSNGNEFENITYMATGNSWTWTPEAKIPTGNYKIEVGTDTSDGFFKIVNSSLVSVVPAGLPTCTLSQSATNPSTGLFTLNWASSNATSQSLATPNGSIISLPSAAVSGSQYNVSQTGVWKMTVSNSTGSNSCQTTIAASIVPPAIITLNPSSSSVGASVTINGSGFTKSNIVLFSGSKAATVSSADGTTLTFAVPGSLQPNCAAGSTCPMYMQQLSPGSYSITVQNENGTSNAVSLTLTGQPISVAPPVAGDLPSNLCIADAASGGHVYALDDHDWFDKDATLSVSDTWPESNGAEWSNQQPVSIWKDKPIKAGRAREDDDSYYPSQQQVADWGVQPVAAIIPGVGLELRSYPVSNPSPTETAALNPDGRARKHISGGLMNSKAYSYGYWVYSVQLPGGAPWFPAVWLLNMGAGDYEEIDTEEQWVANKYVSQSYRHDLGTVFGKVGGTYIETSNSAQHTYGALKTPNAAGLYMDGQASSPSYPPTTPEYSWMHPQTVGLNPILSFQVCQAGTWCGASTAAEANATGKMIVKYYAHYSPTAATCSNYDVPPALPQ